MKFFKKKFRQNMAQKGIALLLTVIIISVVMLIATLISNIVITQLKLAGDINDSGAAIYAADSGVEWQLYQIRKGASVPAPVMSNSAAVSVTVTGTSPNFTIKSLGSYRTVKRQFEVSF
jgi:Tfp pilus assembly protein PilX